MNFDEITLTSLTPRTKNSASHEMEWYMNAKDKVFEKVRELGFNVKLEAPIKNGIPRVDVHAFNKTSAYMLELQYLAQDRVRYDLRNRKYAVSGGIAKPVCQWLYQAGTSPLNLSRELRLKDLVISDNLNSLGFVVHKAQHDISKMVLSWNSKAFDEFNIELHDFGQNAIFFPLNEWMLGAEGFVPVRGSKAHEVLTFIEESNKKTLGYEAHQVKVSEREAKEKMLRGSSNPFQRLEEMKKLNMHEPEDMHEPKKKSLYEYGMVSIPESNYNYTTDDPDVRKFVRAYKERDINPSSQLVEFLIHQKYDSELDRNLSILIGYNNGVYRDTQVQHILGKESLEHLPYFLEYGSIWEKVDGDSNNLRLKGDFAARYKG